MEATTSKQDILNDINDLKDALAVTSDPGRKAMFEAKIAELEAQIA